MQIDKFYKAQDLHKEILSMKDVLTALEKPDSFSLTLLDKLHTSVKGQLHNKTSDVLKKELSKIIKQREKDFIDL